jgi:hypothetical protein
MTSLFTMILIFTSAETSDLVLECAIFCYHINQVLEDYLSFQVHQCQ